MKYCTKCKKIYNNSAERCCGKKLTVNPSTFSPVAAVTANGFELERIRAALNDAEIAYSVQQIKKDTGLQILNSAPPENCTVYVPLCDYDAALSVLIGIGAIDEAAAPEFSDEDIQELQKAKEQAESEELSPRKRFWVRLLSLIGFLLILTGVAYLTDWLLSFVTPYLGR